MIIDPIAHLDATQRAIFDGPFDEHYLNADEQQLALTVVNEIRTLEHDLARSMTMQRIQCHEIDHVRLFATCRDIPYIIVRNVFMRTPAMFLYSRRDMVRMLVGYRWASEPWHSGSPHHVVKHHNLLQEFGWITLTVHARETRTVMRKWLDENCRGIYLIIANSIIFEHRADAVAYRMRF